MKDPIGMAIHDHQFKKPTENININSNLTEGEEINPSYFFRTKKEMPFLEKRALDLCQGKILDIGAGAGPHSIILQKQGFEVTALEQSPLSCEVLKARGISNVENCKINEYNVKQFDTILLLMNGIGIAGDMHGLHELFGTLKKLLNPDGQILLDSSDIKYLFEEEDGSIWLDISSENYYGEMEYQATYKNVTSSPFKWLFVDFDNLSDIASKYALKCEKLADGDHFDYLAKLTHKNI